MVKKSQSLTAVLEICMNGTWKIPLKENMPILEDFYNILLERNNDKATGIATRLEIYVLGSMNVFNHHTNVNIDNRIVCFDIKELGSTLKMLGILIVQETVWGRVAINRNSGKSTRYYIDEFHLLLKDEQQRSTQ